MSPMSPVTRVTGSPGSAPYPCEAGPSDKTRLSANVWHVGRMSLLYKSCPNLYCSLLASLNALKTFSLVTLVDLVAI